MSKLNMPAREPFWKWHHWKTIGFWPEPQTNMHMKCEIEIPKQSYTPETIAPTDGQTNMVNPVYPPPTSLGGGIMTVLTILFLEHLD